MPLITITVRDARAGRDTALLTEAGGEVLAEYEHNGAPYNEGDKLALPDGTEVEVVGLDERITDEGWTQTLHVSNVWE